MKRFCFTLLTFFIVASPAALASSYNQALKTTSPLSPASKPFKNQTPYSKTAQFKNLNEFNRSLKKKVKAKNKYDKKRLASARGAVNKKLLNNLKTITTLQSDGALFIRQAADQRVAVLRNGLFSDYQVGFNKIKTSYLKNLKTLTKKRNMSYTKNRTAYFKRLKKAYTSSQQKKVRSRHQKTMVKIRSYYYLKVKDLRANTKRSSSNHMNKFKSQFRGVRSQVNSQANRSIELLNKRTSAQLSTLRKQRLEAIANLKRLSGRKSISLINPSVKKASNSQLISPITYPKQPTVLTNWPDLKTPKKYLIPKNYLPKNVIDFQNKQTKNICSLGSSYLKNIKKHQSLKKTLQTSARSVKDAKKNYSVLKKDYRRANAFYLQKKKIYKKEQKLRLKRPDDSLLTRAKNRYVQAKSTLAGAKESLNYSRLNLVDATSLYKKYQSASRSAVNRARKYRLSQKRLIKKTELDGKAKRSCPSLIV
jgi:hypothetical protein